MSDGPSFDWFTDFVNQWLGLCVTFARRRSWQEMIDAFGGESGSAVTTSFEQATGLSEPKVRAGRAGHWGYTVEHLTSLGSSEPVLASLSGGDGEAFSLSYTQTINAFMYSVDGRLVSGFDMTVPHIRYGSEPDRFEQEMRRAGFGASDVLPTPAMGAVFVQEIFGIALSRELLEAPLPAARLP